MFLFSCRPGEKVVLIGRDVTVEVVDVMSNRVRVGVEAPNGVQVVRTKIRDLPCTRSSYTLPERVSATAARV